MTDTSEEAVEVLSAIERLKLHVECDLSAPDLDDLNSEVDALLAERDALRDFYDAAVADGAEDVPGAPDEESIGWVGDRDMVMTYGHIRRAALAAPATPQVMHEDAPSAVLSEIGNQIHNIGCELHGNEELQERLACLASRIWDAAKLVSSETPATAANGEGT